VLVASEAGQTNLRYKLNVHSDVTIPSLHSAKRVITIIL